MAWGFQSGAQKQGSGGLGSRAYRVEGIQQQATNKLVGPKATHLGGTAYQRLASCVCVRAGPRQGVVVECGLAQEGGACGGKSTEGRKTASSWPVKCDVLRVLVLPPFRICLSRMALQLTNLSGVALIPLADLSKGPIELHAPDTNGRFYVLQLLDFW